MTINIFMHIYIGENAHWDIYAPPWQKHYTIFFIQIFNFFSHFRCILLQISHQKCFFISISIPGRSGVKAVVSETVDSRTVVSEAAGSGVVVSCAVASWLQGFSEPVLLFFSFCDPF